MKWFNRKKQDSSLPKEVQQYYKGERRQRTSVAWLLALVTLLITLVVALTVFWIGRWAYRALTDNNHDKKKSTTITTQVEKTGTSSASTSTPSTPAKPGTPATPNSTNSSTQTPSSVPNTGQTVPDNLINTGPGDNPDPGL